MVVSQATRTLMDVNLSVGGKKRNVEWNGIWNGILNGMNGMWTGTWNVIWITVQNIIYSLYLALSPGHSQLFNVAN